MRKPLMLVVALLLFSVVSGCARFAEMLPDIGWPEADIIIGSPSTRGNNERPIEQEIPPVINDVIVSFIDVGQGDAALIQTHNMVMLIDGGPTDAGACVVRYIDSHGIFVIDYIVASHPHADHIGGLLTVMDSFEIGTVVMPDVTHTTRTFERFIDAIEASEATVIFAEAGTIINMDDVVFTVVSPNSSGYDNLNDYSLIMRMVHGENSFLFTGDAEAISEAEVLYYGWNISADVLAVGHHGSRTSTTQDFLAAVNPRYAVIQLEADNPYGHPHDVVMRRLEGFNVLRNDMHGNIRIVSDGAGLSVYTER